MTTCPDGVPTFTSLTYIREVQESKKITLLDFFRISCFRLCRFRKIRSFISVSLSVCQSVCWRYNLKKYLTEVHNIW